MCDQSHTHLDLRNNGFRRHRSAMDDGCTPIPHHGSTPRTSLRDSSCLPRCLLPSRHRHLPTHLRPNHHTLPPQVHREPHRHDAPATNGSRNHRLRNIHGSRRNDRRTEKNAGLIYRQVINRLTELIRFHVHNDDHVTTAIYLRCSFTVPMSTLWLVPQLVLAGLSEAFNAVGQMEFFNEQFPDQLRSIATAFFCCSQAVAGYLTTLVITIVKGKTNWLNDNINAGRLDYFYYLIAAMTGLNLIFFLISAHRYRSKGSAPETIPIYQQEL